MRVGLRRCTIINEQCCIRGLIRDLSVERNQQNVKNSNDNSKTMPRIIMHDA